MTKSTYILSLALMAFVTTAHGAEAGDTFIVRAGSTFSVTEGSPQEPPILSSYRVTSKETENEYEVIFRESHCRRGVSLYFNQALSSIPAIYGYELEYMTPQYMKPRGYIFRMTNGYFIEYMDNLKDCISIHVSATLTTAPLLSAIHEINYLIGEVISDNMAVNNQFNKGLGLRRAH